MQISATLRLKKKQNFVPSWTRKRSIAGTMNVSIDGKRLREIRLSRLMERQELADGSGVSRSAIARIELGQTTARLATIKKLARVLEVDAGELVGREVVSAG